MKNFIFILFSLIIFLFLLVFQLKKPVILKYWNIPKVVKNIHQEKLNNENSNEIYVIFNMKNHKYHKIECKYAKNCADFRYIPLLEAQKMGEPCKMCFEEIKKDIIHKNFYFKQNNIEFVSINPKLTNKPNASKISLIGEVVLKTINEAKSSIDIAMYEFDSQILINSLKKAQNRGVLVRIVVDNTPNRLDFNDKLPSNFAIRTDKDCEAGFIMHNKFLVVDKEIVITGSCNFTNTDISGFNSNNLIKIRSTSLAKAFEEQFEEMFDGRFHRQKTAKSIYEIPFCPDNICVGFSPQAKIVDNLLIKEILKAKKLVYIPIFFLTEENLAKALVDAHKKGVDIKIILDATAARNPRTIHEYLRREGIKVKVEDWAGKMHQKAMVVDDKVVVGSMNFSRSGNLKNDENCLILKNKALAIQYQKHFMELYNSIPDKWLYKNPAPEGYDSVGSCFDGIDNDYNGFVDEKDKKCEGVLR